MKALALDLGASSGRILSGDFDGNTLRVREVHRFDNEPVQSGGHLTWDIPRISGSLLEGLRKAALEGFSSFGIDSFCNDYGLLDEGGKLLAPVYAYRDRRTDGVLERMDAAMSARELYTRTGNQRARFNTLVQLVAHMQGEDRHALEQAETLLFVPDLLNYYLCGEKAAEFTIASVSQLYNRLEGAWDGEIFERFGLPRQIMPEVVPPARYLGKSRRDLAGLAGTPEFTVCTVGHHDTASAVAAVPSAEAHFAYISSGTWSLMGTETDGILCTQAAFERNFANEGAANGRNRFLKNIMGLWLLQECRKQMASKGGIPTFGELDAQAETATPFRSIIDPDEPLFFEPGDMIGKIQSACRGRGEPIPVTAAEITRCIQEGLALAYRFTLEQLEELTCLTYGCVHIIGGGARSSLLNRLAASAMNRPVLAGPYEAAAVGNLLAQCIAAGEVRGWDEARQVVRGSFSAVEYLPQDQAAWDAAYGRFLAVKKAGAQRV